MKAVSTAIGDEYDLSVVKGNCSFRKLILCILQLSLFLEGCKTYRRTLCEGQKQTTAPIRKQKLVRSRKHRVGPIACINYVARHINAKQGKAVYMSKTSSFSKENPNNKRT